MHSGRGKGANGVRQSSANAATGTLLRRPGDDSQAASGVDAVTSELLGRDAECPVVVDDHVKADVGVGVGGAAHDAEGSRGPLGLTVG